MFLIGRIELYCQGNLYISQLVILQKRTLTPKIFNMTEIHAHYGGGFHGIRRKNIKITEGEKADQGELAEKAGISGNHLSRLERGVFQPSIDVVRRLAQALESMWTGSCRRG